MKTAAERDLASTVELMEHKSDEAEAILAKAGDEGRDPTEEERKQISDLLTEVKNLRKKKDEYQSLVDTSREIRELSGKKKSEVTVGDISDVQVQNPTPQEIKSLGDQFIESKGYKELLEKGLSGEWSTGPVNLETKGTLATSVGSVLSPNEYVPGIVETLYQRNYVADLFPNIQTSANQVTYVSETTATNASAAVAEQGNKPESTLIFGEASETVRKIATLLPVTDETLEDAPQIRQYINSRLTLFVRNTEENQLLLGNGTAPNLPGIISPGSTNRTIGTYARGTVDSNAVAVFKAANGARGSSQLDMETVIIHPTNWQAIRLATDSSGQFFGGGPFYGPYGGPQGPASASQFSAEPGIWGLNVLVTSNITVGTALVGNFSQGGAVFRKSGITVEATNSHSTYFANNITTLRAEERLALAIYRPSAFVAVTGLS